MATECSNVAGNCSPNLIRYRTNPHPNPKPNYDLNPYPNHRLTPLCSSVSSAEYCTTVHYWPFKIL